LVGLHVLRKNYGLAGASVRISDVEPMGTIPKLAPPKSGDTPLSVGRACLYMTVTDRALKTPPDGVLID